jgi:hypothetical protein
MNQTKVIENNYDYSSGYAQLKQTNPQHQPNAPVIEGYFPKENIIKEMAIRKINTTLTILLGIFLVTTAVSYYFATANEIVLNNLSRQTIVLNDENADLQNKLDRLKSFNNVDMTMQKNNMLTKAEKVIEVPAVSSSKVSDRNFNIQKPLSWAIGY